MFKKIAKYAVILLPILLQALDALDRQPPK